MLGEDKVADLKALRKATFWATIGGFLGVLFPWIETALLSKGVYDTGVGLDLMFLWLVMIVVSAPVANNWAVRISSALQVLLAGELFVTSMQVVPPLLPDASNAGYLTVLCTIATFFIALGRLGVNERGPPRRATKDQELGTTSD